MTVGGRQTTGEKVAPVIDNQMQLEAKVPAHRAASPRCPTEEDAVVMDTMIITDRKESRIDETDATTAPEQTREVGAQQRGDARDELDKAGIADQTGKFSAEMRLDIFGVVRLEVAILALMKVDQDRHDFTRTQLSCSSTMAFPIRHLLRLQRWGDTLIKVIDMAIQFQ